MEILPWRNNEGRNRSTQEDKRRHYDANIDSCLPIYDSSRVMLLVLAWTIVRTCSSAFQKYDWFIVRLDSVNCFKKSPGLEKDYWNWHNEHDECRSGSMKSRGIWSCPAKEQFRMIKADSACLKKAVATTRTGTVHISTITTTFDLVVEPSKGILQWRYTFMTELCDEEPYSSRNILKQGNAVYKLFSIQPSFLGSACDTRRVA